MTSVTNYDSENMTGEPHTIRRWLNLGLAIGAALFLFMLAGEAVSIIHHLQNFPEHSVLTYVSSESLFVLGLYGSQFVPFLIYKYLWRRVLQSHLGQCRHIFLQLVIVSGLVGMTAFLVVPAVGGFFDLISRGGEQWMLFFMLPMPLLPAVGLVGLIGGGIGVVLGLLIASVVAIATGGDWMFLFDRG